MDQPPKKPALLKGGMMLCWLYAGLLVIYLFAVPALPPTGSRDLIVSAPGIGREDASVLVGKPARRAVTILLVASIAIAYALAKDKRWSRPMLLAILILGVVSLPLTPGMGSGPMYAASIALAVLGWWYLYRKPNVVRYYAAIEERRLKGN